MDKVFEGMMQGCCSGMPEESRQKMKDCIEKMAAFCPCGSMKDMDEKGKTAMMEKMKAFFK